MSNIAEQLIRQAIRAISSYHVPDPGDLIKLDAMENPYSWPESMREEWLTLMANIDMNRYPDPSASGLHSLIRQTMAIPDEMAIIFGNGSDELIQIMAQAVAEPGRTIMAPEPSFVMYQMISTFTNMEYVAVPLNDDFSLNRKQMLAAIEEHQPAIIFLAYPNNPTGNLFDDDVIEEILHKADGLVVVDEAYHAFAGKSWMGRLGAFDNLVVMRTLSKLGLAGLRLGVLAGPSALLTEFDKVRLPYNINVLTQASVGFALERIELFNHQTAAIRNEREWLFNQLQQRETIYPYPSAANFILFKIVRGSADSVFNAIKENGVLIKNMSKTTGPLANCLRVTVGKPDENTAFLNALDKVLNSED